MQIPLKTDWEARIPGKAKVYPLGGKVRALVDETFDDLHETGNLSAHTVQPRSAILSSVFGRMSTESAKYAESCIYEG